MLICLQTQLVSCQFRFLDYQYYLYLHYHRHLHLPRQRLICVRLIDQVSVCQISRQRSGNRAVFYSSRGTLSSTNGHQRRSRRISTEREKKIRV